MWPSSLTPMHAASSAGGSARRRTPASSSRPSSRRFTSAARPRAWASSITATADLNTCPSAPPSASAWAGIEPSVGRVGDSHDNALAKTVNGLFKAEVIHRRGPWRSLIAVESAALDGVDGFSNRRLLEPIGTIPPAEAEANLYAAPEPSTLAA